VDDLIRPNGISLLQRQSLRYGATVALLGAIVCLLEAGVELLLGRLSPGEDLNEDAGDGTVPGA
jgi:hypothetical protein